MTTKELARKFFHSLWNERNPQTIHEMMDPQVLGRSESGEIHSPKEFETKVYDPLIKAFPDFNVVIEGIVAEDDEAVVRWTVHATHKGALDQLPPSNRRVRFCGMTWMRFENGKMVEGDDRYNLHALVTYLASGAESASVRFSSLTE